MTERNNENLLTKFPWKSRLQHFSKKKICWSEQGCLCTNNFAYAGVQYYGYCFCGNTLPPAATSPGDCNFRASNMTVTFMMWGYWSKVVEYKHSIAYYRNLKFMANQAKE